MLIHINTGYSGKLLLVFILKFMSLCCVVHVPPVVGGLSSFRGSSSSCLLFNLAGSASTVNLGIYN